MIYTHQNTLPVQVFALDPLQRIDRVLAIDTERAVIRQVADPLRIDTWGELVFVERQFEAVWPIFDREKPWPVLFHCYGEKNAAAPKDGSR